MISFVLPAYNEEANLPPLMHKIGETMAGVGRPYRVVAVNDGSRDGTARVLAELAAAYPVEVVVHEVNLGLPRTMVDGLKRAAVGAGAEDIVITMDADNSHEPRYVPAMVAALEKGYDVVIASRYRPGAKEVGLSWERSVMSRAVNLMLAVLFPIPGVRDYTCGYRAYRAQVLQGMFSHYGERLVESTTFSAMAELLLKAGMLGARMTEVPLVLRYDQKAGTSKMKVLRTILDYLRLMAVLRLRGRRA
ncbi:MAG TPA: glycosyltransferase [Firmicutes bacterium]|nr:glycosyltransferase [Bacillota bacterium]